MTVVSESESAAMAQTIDIHKEPGHEMSGSAPSSVKEVVK